MKKLTLGVRAQVSIQTVMEQIHGKNVEGCVSITPNANFGITGLPANHVICINRMTVCSYLTPKVLLVLKSVLEVTVGLN